MTKKNPGQEEKRDVDNWGLRSLEWMTSVGCEGGMLVQLPWTVAVSSEDIISIEPKPDFWFGHEYYPNLMWNPTWALSLWPVFRNYLFFKNNGKISKLHFWQPRNWMWKDTLWLYWIKTCTFQTLLANQKAALYGVFQVVLFYIIKPCVIPNFLYPSQHVSKCDSVSTHYVQQIKMPG